MIIGHEDPFAEAPADRAWRTAKEAGLLLYFTRRPCVRNHRGCGRYVSSRRCVLCTKMDAAVQKECKGAPRVIEQRLLGRYIGQLLLDLLHERGY